MRLELVAQLTAGKPVHGGGGGKGSGTSEGDTAKVATDTDLRSLDSLCRVLRELARFGSGTAKQLTEHPVWTVQTQTGGFFGNSDVGLRGTSRGHSAKSQFLRVKLSTRPTLRAIVKQ